MTLEKRVVFTVGDIRHIRFVCKKCEHGTICFANKSSYSLPDRCPWCGEEWNGSHTRLGGEQWDCLKKLLKVVIGGDEIHPKVDIHFEIEDERGNP